MAQVRARLAMAAILIVWAWGAQAATIGPSDGQGMGCLLRIDGPMASGDADRLSALLEETELPAFDMTPVGQRICLDSAGGLLAEAVRTAEVISQNNLGTAVPEGAACESACAVLFMAGRFLHPEGEMPTSDRILHPRGRLGFHAPALVVEDRAYDRKEVNSAYAVALASMGEILRLRSEGGSEIPDSLILTMLFTPPEDMTYVETVEQAARWMIEVAPVALTAEDIETALRHACLNADGGMLDERPSDTYLYGSANLPFAYGNLGPDRAQVTSEPAFRAEAAARCEMTMRADGEPLDRIGYLTMEGGAANEATRREVYPYLFYDPRLPLSALPVARTQAETGEEIFFAAIRAAAQTELSEVEIRTCRLLEPEARIANVSEYVNLRDEPGFDGEVLRQIPLGERVRVIATQDLRTPGGDAQARRCLAACNELAADPGDDDLRRQVNACIDDNVFWYEIRDGSGTAGHVSRKFLAE